MATPNPIPFRPANPGLTTVGLSLAVFMQVLDTTIANVSLPTIAGNLGASADQATWVITSFAVSNAIALPLTGFLARRFGEVRLFVATTLLFVFASFLCGIAQSMTMLIAFRAFQGAVAGPMYPVTQSLLLSIYPPEKRSQALALLVMVTIVAPIAGPILGGWITDSYSWPWIFFVNVPVGVLAALVVYTQMRGRSEQVVRPKMDYVGLATLVIGVGALQIVLDKGNDEDWFQSNFIIVTAIVSAVALAVFLIWELTDKEPIVDLKLFRHNNFAFGTIAMTMAYGAFFAINVLIPQWLQRYVGYTATWAGLAASPIGFLPILLTPFVGRYINRVDLRFSASAAFCVMGLTSFIRSGFYLDVDFHHVAMAQFVQGLGVTFFLMPLMQIMLSDLQPNEIASGTGLATFVRNLGGSFAASITNFMWQHRAIVHHAQLSEHLTPFDPATQQAVATIGQGNDPLAYRVLERMIDSQSYQISFNEIFHMLGYIFLSLIVVIWFARPPFTAKGGGAAAH
ncbi:MAG: DHA2 family efflux MFS transporter permease subunit [Proteobacteria bacterium]|uniref:DHA2 family efflux MFS transporter permease subunit n=1 Tax=Rudaea sp. TaxID=2136325 RepID=UPI001D2DC832|nr:DHA2 family efflux MFS transporter permease subunit [Pseudomonadota bacterium]MBS0566247.1 DHA2 family efflux MFS transporter permease subunit [Pseudomonadota bacterium]